VIVSYAAIALALMTAGGIIAAVVIISLGIHAEERAFRKRLMGVRKTPARGARSLLGGAYYIPDALRPTGPQQSDMAQRSPNRTSVTL
jgi:hypothetical protein